MNFDRLLYKLDSVLAWVLYLLFILMMISGYMITRNFMSYHIGAFIHIRLDAPTMVLLSFHVAINMRRILIRRGFKGRLSRGLIPILLGLIPL
ncbi:MAG: hypothetical protein ACP5QI_05065, partial [Candidatus Bathyarchaeia archaeon]